MRPAPQAGAAADGRAEREISPAGAAASWPLRASLRVACTRCLPACLPARQREGGFFSFFVRSVCALALGSSMALASRLWLHALALARALARALAHGRGGGWAAQRRALVTSWPAGAWLGWLGAPPAMAAGLLACLVATRCPLPVARCPLPAAAAAGAAACVLHGLRRTTRPRRVHMMLACPDVSAPSALRAGERYCM